jgi:fructokinase
VVDVVTCGEALIDFIALRQGKLAESPLFRRMPGGAPANVAVGVARLGRSAAFLGQVGDDEFGHFLVQTLEQNGVEVSGLRLTAEARTALAFVSLREDGERDFLFYGQPSADMLWRPDDLPLDLIASARIFHFGSISLITDPARSATLAAVAHARANNVLVSYDPNLRLALWPSPEAARSGIRAGWALAHVIKVSEEELTFLAPGVDDIDHAVRSLWHSSIRLFVVTRGAAGCRYYTDTYHGEVPGFRVERVVDTTGAGDGFVAGLLVGLLEHEEPWLPADIEAILRFANAVGALTTTRRGAIPALPRRARVEAFLDRQNGARRGRAMPRKQRKREGDALS